MEPEATQSKQRRGSSAPEEAADAARSEPVASSPAAPWLKATGLIAAALLAFAYRALATYDPSESAAANVDGADLYLFAPTGSSPALIFGLTALLIFMRRRHLRGCLGAEGRLWPGALLVACSVVLTAWAHHVSSPDLQIPALSLLLLGTGLLLGGRHGLGLVAAPSIFLLLAVTPPAAAINQILFALQLATAQVSTALLNGVGIDAVAEGDLIYTSRAVFHVIETCSGWRGILTLLMTAFVYAEILYLGRIRYIAVVMAAVPIAFFLNQLRVVAIVLIPSPQFGEDHTTQGLVAVVGGVLLLAMLDGLMGRWIGDPGPRSWSHTSPIHATRRLAPVRAGLVIAALFITAIATVAVPVWVLDEPRPTPLSGFPPKIGSLQASGLPLAREYLGSVNPDEWTYRDYAQPENSESTRVFLAGDRRLSRNRSLLSPKTMRPGAGSVVLTRESVELPEIGGIFDVLSIRKQDEHILVYHWRDGVGSLLEEVTRAWLGLDRSAWRRSGRATAIRIETSFEPRGRPNDQNAARRRLNSMAKEVVHFLNS